jgi:hypothetical protein
LTLRAEIKKVTGKFHLPLGVLRGERNIRNIAIGWKAWIYREEGTADDPFVFAEVIAAADFDSAEFGMKRISEKKEKA